MNFKYTRKAEEVIERSKVIASELGFSHVGTEHILLALLDVSETVAKKALEAQKVNRESILDLIQDDNLEKSDIENLEFTPKAVEILKFSETIAKRTGHTTVGTEHILMSILDYEDNYALDLLKKMGVSVQKIYEELMGILVPSTDTTSSSDLFSDDDNNKQTSPLEEYSKNLTEAAKLEEFDPVVCRNDEMDRIIQILCRRTKNNPCLVGEPGVGKTAIVEGLSQRIVSGNVPDFIKNKRILSLNLTAMVADTKYRGEFEDRIKKIIDEVKNSDDIILFIDEIHNIIGFGAAEGSMDASNILKPCLSRGEIQVIGATTLEEYRKNIEKDAALERRFQPVKIEEPSEENAIKMINGLRKKYEDHHNLKITDEAVKAAVRMSVRYISDRALPDKAIDLIDEAASKLKLKTTSYPKKIEKMIKKAERIEGLKEEALKEKDIEKYSKLSEEQKNLRIQAEKEKILWDERNKKSGYVLKEEDIANVVSLITGVPLSTIKKSETEKLVNMEEEIHKRIIGQNEAVSVVCKAVRRGRIGLKDPKRPIGSFLFLGPTGVGKTELAKSLTEVLFGDEKAMIRIDMSEYMEKHSVSKLIGSPPGYVGHDAGGQVFEKIRRKPYSVVLFDEVEKAAPEVFNIMLQILDDGHITDSVGRKVDFKNTVIIMTSNIGARSITNKTKLGFSTASENDKDYEDMKKNVMNEVKQVFRPEFINRIDDIIVFHQLKTEELKDITALMLNEVSKRVLSSVSVDLKFSDEIVSYITEKGSDKDYGARPLRRYIQTNIEDVFAEEYLSGKFSNKKEVICIVKDDKPYFEAK